MDRRRRINLSRAISSLLITLLAIFSSTMASAQFGGVVFDPKNYIQNLYSASRSLVQIRQQVSQLQNEARMLVGQAKDLASLDFNAQGELMRILDEIARLNNGAETVAYEVETTRTILREQFPEDYSKVTEDEAAVMAESQWKLAKDGYHQSMIMQSALVESLAHDRKTLDRIVTESQSATGNLSATQSTNQLLALLIKQNMAWQQMMVSGERADALSQARLMAIEQESREKRLRFVGESSIYERRN